MSDIRRKARRAGLDPDRWFGNVEIMVQHRIGDEPVGYVSNVHRYYPAVTGRAPPS